jgi:hypothetical protein
VTAVLWIAVGVLTAAVVFLLLALNGATRTVSALRRTLDGQDDVGGVVHPASGLPVGSAAPTIESVAADGAHVMATAMRGRRHLVVFADPGCAACQTLVPPLLALSGRVPVALVTRVETALPLGWRAGPDDLVVADPTEGIADAFKVGFTPHVFVVDAGGAIAAQGPADTVEMVEHLLREAEGVRIVDTEVSSGA